MIALLALICLILAIAACATMGRHRLSPAAPTRQRRRSGDGRIYGVLRGGETRPLDPDAATAQLFVAVLEPDRFDQLRESIGYRLSNRLMEEVSRRLADTVVGLEIGRVGRTTIEFAFASGDLDTATAALTRAIERLQEPVLIDDLSFELIVRTGFTRASGTSIRDELVDQAAAALSEAKAARQRLRYADADVLASKRLADLDVMRRLPHAIERGELELHYQPKFDVRAEGITSVEGLLRWHNADLGTVSPDHFIAIAEEAGTIETLTMWVLNRAVRDQARLAELGHELDIYVNISGLLVPDRDFATRALAIVAPAQGKVSFEITETAVISDPAAALENLAAFHAAGIKIAIDDYGSGLSSLSYLKQLPAQELKIDRMFVSGLTQTNRDPLLVRSSIDLAHALEMRVTAEGVDDQMAFALLRIMGCDMLQGYLISPALPFDGLVDFLGEGEYLVRLGIHGDDAAAGPVHALQRKIG